MGFHFQSFIWYVFGAINSWSQLPIFEVPPNHLNVHNTNAINFERLSFYYPQNFTNTLNIFERQRNLALLNACTTVGNVAADFIWVFENEHEREVDRLTTKSCATHWKAPEQGVYTVTLTVRRHQRQQHPHDIVTYRKNIRFVDYWIVSIGDSFSSGEGNPDTQRTLNGRAEWLSEKCHRSKKSWPHKVYEKILHFARNKFAVHFTYLACSGASVDSGFLPIMSQLDTVEAIKKLNRKGPEVVFVSAGGNDVGFSSIINQLLHKRSLSASRINLRLLFVQHQLDRLAKRLKQAIEPSQVIIPTYFQFANNDQGQLDTRCADLIQMTKHDLRFAENKILQRLNELIVLKSKEYGWTPVTVTYLFDRAGLCAKKSLIRTSMDSIKLQGDARGSLHPTEEAHSQIAEIVFSKLNFRQFLG